MVIIPGLKQGLFPGFPWHIGTHSTLHIFWPNLKKHQKSLKNYIFGQISNSSLIFYPLPNLGLSFKLIMPPYPVIIEVTLAKISFSKLITLVKSTGKNLRAIDLTNPSLGITRVNFGFSFQKAFDLLVIWFVRNNRNLSPFEWKRHSYLSYIIMVAHRFHHVCIFGY